MSLGNAAAVKQDRQLLSCHPDTEGEGAMTGIQHASQGPNPELCLMFPTTWHHHVCMHAPQMALGVS